MFIYYISVKLNSEGSKVSIFYENLLYYVYIYAITYKYV